jgi:hypothetical protein
VGLRVAETGIGIMLLLYGAHRHEEMWLRGWRNRRLGKRCTRWESMTHAR